ncbi:hypothetical protein Tco_0451187 [Tanacetum coccineum]
MPPPLPEKVTVGECGEGSGIHWWKRVGKVVVVGRRRDGGVMVVDDGASEKSTNPCVITPEYGAFPATYNENIN